jgi:hypothetical protein
MTYTLALNQIKYIRDVYISDESEDNEQDYPWFYNSYKTIENWEHKDIDLVDREYELKFGVRFIYGHDIRGTVKPIVGIEFPSHAHATMFMLKWS